MFYLDFIAFLYLSHSQDEEEASPYENAPWEFILWSWDRLHLPKHFHENRDSIDQFYNWLKEEVTSLTDQDILNKHAMQNLLLGLSLLLRDYEIVCFYEEGFIPEDVTGSVLEPEDIDMIGGVLKMMIQMVERYFE